MPFGKYEGRYLIDLPEYYVVWYSNKGFPKGVRTTTATHLRAETK
jgi:uncharacterized protein (DUF3820 family)